MNQGIDVQSISVIYRTKNTERRALDTVSFQAHNTFVAMLGPNGAGKSTLMGTICSTIHPDSGSVISPTNRDQLAIVFQTPALDELLTVRENMILAGAMHGLSKQATLKNLEPLAALLAISDRLHDQVRHLSGGLQRRVDLARALISKPTILLLDEPTTGLDIEARRMFWDLLNEIHTERPMTILLATHMTEEADLAHRVLLINEGKIIADAQPSELKAQLGQRVLRIKTPQSGPVRQWASDSNLDHRASGNSVTIAHATQQMMHECPISDASMTLAPPTLTDVYTWHTGTALGHTTGDAS